MSSTSMSTNNTDVIHSAVGVPPDWQKHFWALHDLTLAQIASLWEQGIPVLSDKRDTWINVLFGLRKAAAIFFGVQDLIDEYGSVDKVPIEIPRQEGLFQNTDPTPLTASQLYYFHQNYLKVEEQNSESRAKMEFPCPTCRALPGRHCVDVRGWATGYSHYNRSRYARFTI